MPIPSPEERPDLYDDYDGLPEGHKSDVTTPLYLQELIDQRIAERQAKAKLNPKPTQRPRPPFGA